MKSDRLWSRPRIVGIVEIDEVERALATAAQQVSEGADIIEVRVTKDGGPVAAEEEGERLREFLERWDRAIVSARPRFKEQCSPPLLSVTSPRPEVVETILKTGKVALVNDRSVVGDAGAAGPCSRHGAMLMISSPAGKVSNGEPEESPESILSFFEEKIRLARLAGLDGDRLLLAPCPGTGEHVSRLPATLERLSALGHPLILTLPSVDTPEIADDLSGATESDAEALALLSHGIRTGIHGFRTHRVKQTAETARVLHALTTEES